MRKTIYIQYFSEGISICASDICVSSSKSYSSLSWCPGTPVKYAYSKCQWWSHRLFTMACQILFWWWLPSVRWAALVLCSFLCFCLGHFCSVFWASEVFSNAPLVLPLIFTVTIDTPDVWCWARFRNPFTLVSWQMQLSYTIYHRCISSHTIKW